MWIRLATATVEENLFELYEQDGLHMIRVNGLELMNGKCHESEDLLGRLGAEITLGDSPEILVGGLGLGYTLASLIDNLGPESRITVAELSAAILDWFGRYTGPALFRRLPATVSLVNENVAALLGEAARWDLIVLDVDNGPRAFSTPSNDALYGRTGLRRCWDSLKPGGNLLVWSSFEEPAFIERARSTGFRAQTVPVVIAERPEPFHFVYRLAKHR
ncbi:MAG TPA: hypothetical protein VM689_19050 [Aliidongia sp.]|nr:hypothetical protein [Aliidongia sp.]